MALKFLGKGAFDRRLRNPNYAHAESMTDAAVRVRDLTKKYGDTVAVDGIDFDIRPGEIFSLLGPNGAGKTTVVEILEGHRTRDGGHVEALGIDPQTAPRSWYDRIGIVLQESTETPELTVLEVVRHYASYYSNSRDPGELIENVGLAEDANSRVYQLSGGRRRRLDVALGIVGRPQLLFLDEPTTGFDPEARREFWTLVRNLAAEGTAILLTTHYLDEAEALADRVAVLLRGRIALSGEPATFGGRSIADVRVSWLGRNGMEVVQTQTPARVIEELARQFGDMIPELTVTRPSLEDVYLELIERHSDGDHDETS
jgi:ABC-2 type transport system ATP-binding protein